MTGPPVERTRFLVVDTDRLTPIFLFSFFIRFFLLFRLVLFLLLVCLSFFFFVSVLVIFRFSFSYFVFGLPSDIFFANSPRSRDLKCTRYFNRIVGTTDVNRSCKKKKKKERKKMSAIISIHVTIQRGCTSNNLPSPGLGEGG